MVFNGVPASGEELTKLYLAQSGNAFAQEEEKDKQYENDGRISASLDDCSDKGLAPTERSFHKAPTSPLPIHPYGHSSRWKRGWMRVT
jgi:hypothetical protein